MPRLATPPERSAHARAPLPRGPAGRPLPPASRGGANDNDLALFRLPARGLHRIEAAYPDLPVAAGFSLGLLTAAATSQSAKGGAAVLWVFTARAEREWGRPWGRGLLGDLGLDPGGIVLVRVGRDREVCWALEEGLRAGAGLAAVVGEAGIVDFAAQRRLALLASGRKLPAFLLTGLDETARGSPAAARWRVSPSPSAPHALDPAGPGAPRWRVDLLRYHAGPPGTWTLEWDREANRLRLAPGVADRAAAADPRPPTVRTDRSSSSPAGCGAGA
jgi:protein ImuA